MSSFIDQNPAFLLSATCNEILSLMIEIWMKNHLVSVGNWDIVNLYSLQKNYKNWKTFLG